MKETNFARLYVVLILKDIIKKINSVDKKIKKNTENLSNYGLCDRTSRYWRMQHNHDVYMNELNDLYKVLYELNLQTEFLNSMKYQDRFDFLKDNIDIVEEMKRRYVLK